MIALREAFFYLIDQFKEFKNMYGWSLDMHEKLDFVIRRLIAY